MEVIMNRIQEVKPLDDFYIEVLFIGGEIKRYDVKQLFPVFPQFEVFKTDVMLFKNVKVDTGGYGISWNDELDLEADTIWEDGVLIETVKENSINRIIAYQMLMAREKAGITQKELAEKTGIYQADISKIERGLGNPSILTLKRLADGLGAELEIKIK